MKLKSFFLSSILGQLDKDFDRELKKRTYEKPKTRLPPFTDGTYVKRTEDKGNGTPKSS